MATPLAGIQHRDGGGGVAVMTTVNGTVNGIDPMSRKKQNSSPIHIFLFFHKAIRSELDLLHRSAIDFATNSHVEIEPLLKRYHFLRSLYKHHCNAEDELTFYWICCLANAPVMYNCIWYLLRSMGTGSDLHEALDPNDYTFKPGWKDIFRMNQNELESEIRKVSRDPTLDPRRKDYLIQNLMTSGWIAAQQKLPQGRKSETSDVEGVHGCSPSFRDAEKQVFGCEHYKRNCKLRAACCQELFTCRFCHDNVSDHTMDRKATTEMMCMNCLIVQPVGPICSTPSCNGLSMAKYYCSYCKFFDDERTVYHCPFCNLCRLGKGLGVDFFHCMTCNYCLGIKLVDHKCREKGLETNCPICCDFLFTSSASVRALPCGHFMHSACFQAYACTHYICPICSKSMGDMSVYFGMLDALMASEVLPEEYRDRCQDILCNDCDKKGNAPFHWLYHKCGSCGSYNTRVIKVDPIAGCSN
ncbi:hemerythrin/HHE cation-binding motif-containing protein [Artemisia annua]|uniref:Hemerythrin/HHE cation-binding motif-containing protein n=1 Tax=Artemisia annua TaxID=35608 RepID=A0A2U1NU04_ARTAN|nr:hemerythrin/HHE cation-binding motif-containing protein [Artemisia annua]